MRGKTILTSGLGILALLGLYFAWYVWIGPYLHDKTLAKFSEQLFEIQLPDNAVLLDRISVVGQQEGNSDHCDYLAAIQLQTELPKSALENHYKNSYSGDSEVKFVWLDEENPYTNKEFDPLVIFSLKDWIINKLDDSRSSVVIYIFESGMTSAIDRRCS